MTSVPASEKESGLSGIRNIRIGNAPCSWGTLEFGSLSGQRKTYADMLDELAAAGYAGSELGDWGFMPTDPAELADAFVSRGLELTGAYVGTPLEDPEQLPRNAETVLRTARLLQKTTGLIGQGMLPHLVLALDNGIDPVRVRNSGRITPEMGLDAAAWESLANSCRLLTERVFDETGLPAAFHHHAAGFVETPAEVERLVQLTEGEVNLVFDTGHFALGAGRTDTILRTMERLADCISYVHFKDWSADAADRVRRQELGYFESVQEGIFCELGQGEVEFPLVRDWLLDHAYTGYVTVEQDIIPGLGSPLESARRSRAYLREIGFL